MTITVLDTGPALAALAPEWEALWRRTPAATPFQSPCWLLPWWRQFGTGMPRVAVARESGGVLCGVLPLYVLVEPGVRKLLPIGAGTTDYLDVLGGPADALLAAALERARADGIGWCDLIDVPPGSPLRGCVPPGWRAEWGKGSPCPVLPLPDNLPALHAAIPHSARRKLRLNRNRAVRAGGVRVETATAATLETLLAGLVRLHQACWTARGEPGTLSDPAVLAWHAEAAPALLHAGVLRLQVLRAGEQVVAACYGLLAGTDRLLFYLSGYDPAHAWISPGSLLLAAMLEEAVAEGRREAHFLRGREEYKYAWGAVDRVNAGGRLWPA